MRIRAIAFQQQGDRFWIGAMRASDLVKSTIVDHWSPSNRDGYQREESERRANGFANFIHQGNPSPTVALLNVRPPGEPKNVGNGELTLPEPVYVVDYQHRRKGLETLMSEDPKFGDFEVPVIITNWEKMREAEFFLIVNKTAKTVRTDLAEQILFRVEKNRGRLRAMDSLPAALVKDIEWRPVAVELMQELNDDRTGPWSGRIRLPNSPKTARITVRQVSFTESLRSVLTDAAISSKGKNGIASIVSAYWKGAERVWPECFKHPQDYVLLGTTGVMVLHRILPFVFGKLNGKDPANPASYAKLLELSGEDGKFWHRDSGEAGRHGTSQKAFGILAAHLRDAIDSAVD